MNTITKVSKLLSEHLGVEIDRVTPEANLVNDLGADSLDTVELVMSAEEEFEIEIDDATAAGVKTVQDLVDVVDRAKK